MMKIPFNTLRPVESKLDMYSEIEEAVQRVIRSGIYLSSIETAMFAHKWGKFCGHMYCVPTSCGTDAITLMLKAAKRKLVHIPANTIRMTAEGAHRAGCAIKFCDVDTVGHVNYYLQDCLPVPLYGSMLNIQESEALYADMAHASGQKPPYEMTCAWSFYPTKTLGAMGDAGAVTTNDEHLYKAMLDLVYDGRENRSPWQIGTRMDEIQAAILNVKLKYFPSHLQQRIQQAKKYENYIRGDHNFYIPFPNSTYHLFVITSRKRDALVSHLAERNIQTKIHYPHVLPYEAAPWCDPVGGYPGATRWCREVLSLPFYDGMTDQEMEYVGRAIQDFN